MESTEKEVQQKIFDLAFNGLRSQGFKASINNIGNCVYRGQNGLKCAIGHAISDEQYDPKIERLGADYSIVRIRIERTIRMPVDIELADFLRVLQQCHDFSSGPESMEAALRAFAVRYELTIPEAT